ncbi:hypothetical protein GCM10011397_25930 [Wenyingzhuangia marina]|nr:hypothetical protein GCM10011397_25930 [Wenyingzhuangia marina]
MILGMSYKPSFNPMTVHIINHARINPLYKNLSDISQLKMVCLAIKKEINKSNKSTDKERMDMFLFFSWNIAFLSKINQTKSFL